MPGNVLQFNFDPANVTLEPEYYGDVNVEKYCERKPLIFFWQMFDRSPLGLNHWLGFRFRKMLAKNIFKHVGKNVKIFHGVEFSFGYNLTVEDDCTIHKYVMLDDRGELIIRKGTSISDYAALYSHWHDTTDSHDIENRTTEVGPSARLTYHTSVMAGVKVGEDAMLGAMGVATHNIPPHEIWEACRPARSGEKNRLRHNLGCPMQAFFWLEWANRRRAFRRGRTTPNLLPSGFQCELPTSVGDLSICRVAVRA